jgi:hypothetical protein
MKIVWALFGLFLLGSVAIGRQEKLPTAPGQGRGAGAPAQPSLAGGFQGLVTSHVSSINGDTITISWTSADKPVTTTFRVGLNTLFFVMPEKEGQPTKMLYTEVRSGGLKQFGWHSDDPTLVGKAIKATLEAGLATEVLLFPVCRRDFCSSSTCNRKCKASNCACPVK